MPSIVNLSERAWADVDLGALKANARTVARISGARLMPMVKANAYGLGAVAVAQALETLEPWGYGVSTVEEGAELRTAGIARPIVVFTPLSPAGVAQHLAHGLRPTVGDTEGLKAWLARGTAPFHVEVDTGMARSGFCLTSGGGWQQLLAGATGFEGCFTHFHSAEENPASVQRQWQRFQELLESLPARPALVHAANSAAALQGNRYAADLVRPGIFLYGGGVGNSVPETVVRLRAPVVAQRIVRTGDSVSYGGSWTAERDTRVATLAIGYADGMLRSLSNRGVVELLGQVAPVIGRVTMDFTMVATEVSVALGEVATVYGGLVSLDEQARRAGTISYELLTSLGPRVPRRYP